MFGVKEKLLPINDFSRPGLEKSSTSKIVWHWVGNAGQGKNGVARYFELLKDQDKFDDIKDRYASAHFIVDEKDIIQCIPDNEVAYHAGKPWHNYNSIGVEICHPDWTGVPLSQTITNLVWLTAQLCKKYKLDPLRDVIRHYDVTGKVCPKWLVENPVAFDILKNRVLTIVKGLNV